MAIRNPNLYDRVAKLEGNLLAVPDLLAEIKQAIRDLGHRIDKVDGRIDKVDGRIDKLDGQIDKLIYWGCATILGTFIALSMQLWLNH